jgi:glyoxylase-like metal-dependent hydrolase (beta-lactamase superfamily II)
VTAVRIGAFEVSRVEEMLTPGFDPAFLFRDWDAAILSEHPLLATPSFFDPASGRLMSSMQSWLVRIDDDVILIDTGCGNGKTRSAPAFSRFHDLHLPYLDNLAARGVRPEDVTYVINTHLHVDHVGWNTRRDGNAWAPTFPNARYVWGRVETEHWLDPAGGLAMQPEAAEVIDDSVRPILEAGLVDLVDAGQSIRPGLTFRAAPGHTVGQLQVWLESEGGTGIFTADCLHQPIQIYRPKWNSRFCELPEAAVATRAALLEEAAERDAVIFPSHFGAPHAGRVTRRPGGYAFAPLPVDGRSDTP